MKIFFELFTRILRLCVKDITEIHIVFSATSTVVSTIVRADGYPLWFERRDTFRENLASATNRSRECRVISRERISTRSAPDRCSSRAATGTAPASRPNRGEPGKNAFPISHDFPKILERLSSFHTYEQDYSCSIETLCYLYPRRSRSFFSSAFWSTLRAAAPKRPPKKF